MNKAKRKSRGGKRWTSGDEIQTSGEGNVEKANQRNKGQRTKEENDEKEKDVRKKKGKIGRAEVRNKRICTDERSRTQWRN